MVRWNTVSGNRTVFTAIRSGLSLGRWRFGARNMFSGWSRWGLLWESVHEGEWAGLSLQGQAGGTFNFINSVWIHLHLIQLWSLWSHDCGQYIPPALMVRHYVSFNTRSQPQHQPSQSVLPRKPHVKGFWLIKPDLITLCVALIRRQ